MPKYQVDLQFCSQELREKFYNVFENHCFEYFHVANHPYRYELVWTSDTPIEKLIPEMYIIRG